MVNAYAEINKVGVRSVMRGAALDALSMYYRVSGKLDSGLRANRVQFLYFHHVFRDEEESFRSLLSTLSKTHRFISYSEGVERLLTGRIDAPYLTVSFDDGIRNCLQASRIMNELGIKGCFFVCPPLADERDPAKIAAFSKTICMPPLEYLDWGDIEEMLRNGHEIGGHTLTHFNLGQASTQRLAEEIGGSYDALRIKLGKVIHFAWPFGDFINFSPAAIPMVFGSGFRSCASAIRGCHVAKVNDPRDLCIRRDCIMATWPLPHIEYFLANNSLRADSHSGDWPEGWLAADKL